MNNTIEWIDDEPNDAWIEGANYLEGAICYVHNQKVNDAYPDFPSAVAHQLNIIRTLLIEKNRKYGNSALEPIGIFSQASPQEIISQQIDHKLARIKSGQSDDTEDSILDLIGYLILLRIARRDAENDK